MKIRATLILLFFSGMVLPPALAQTEIFMDAFQEFSTSRLWEFEEIPIEWNMEGTLQADLNEGLNNLFEDNLSQADASLTTVIKKDSTIWQAYYYRAAARKQLEKFTAAEKDMRNALKLRGDFYDGLVELAKILHLSGQTNESERAINKAIRLNRSRGTAYYLKGDINIAQNQMHLATGNYKDCLAADSLFHNARIKLALLDAVSKKDVSAALVHLDKVLSYDSLQKSALLFRSILGQEKDVRQSIRDLSNLLLVSPNNLMALYYRGLFSAGEGDYERAFIDFHKMIKATSTSDNNFVGRQTWLDKKIDLQNAGAYTLTRVYGLPEEDGRRIKQAYSQILLAQYDKSLAVLNEVSNATQEPVALYLKAVAYEHKGEHHKALQHYSLALELDDAITDAHKKRGIYEQELKQWERSIEDFTIVLKQTPDAFFTHRMRGVSYYHINRFEEAIADFNAYLENDSTNKEVRGFRAMAYLNTDQRLKAYVDFAASDHLQSLNLKDIENLIDSVLQLRDTVQALYCLDIITAHAPYFTEGYVQKFKIHMARNEWNPVAQNISHALRNSRADVAHPKYSYLLTLQAMMLSKNRHNDNALKTLNEAIRVDKHNDLAYLERGRLFLAMGKSSKAEDDFKEASVLGNPDAKQMLAAMSKK